MKKVLTVILALVIAGSMLMVACDQGKEAADKTMLLAAAASLENSFKTELIPLFESKNANSKVEGTYDSSGKLQTQIIALRLN